MRLAVVTFAAIACSSGCAGPHVSIAPVPQPTGGFANHVELEVTGARITGPGVDVRYSVVEGGGYRLTGMWMRANVDLTVTPASCRDPFSDAPALAPGVYGGSIENPWIRMTGEAAALDDPRWPQVALAALSAGLGVRTHRR